MTKLEQLHNSLELLKKPYLDDPYDNRQTHAHLLFNNEGKSHVFEVRGWLPIKDGELNVSVVNWTMCAGTARLTLSEDNVEDWHISEDDLKRLESQ